MPSMSPRTSPKAPRCELVNLLMLIFIDQHEFQTETLRPKTSNHRVGKRRFNRWARRCPEEAPRPQMPTDANTNWKPWADENDDNHACKPSAASAA